MKHATFATKRNQTVTTPCLLLAISLAAVITTLMAVGCADDDDDDTDVRVTADPPNGSTIRPNATIKLTFNAAVVLTISEPAEPVAPIFAFGGAKVWNVTAPSNEGPWTLNVTWTDSLKDPGSPISFSYTLRN